MLSTQPFRTMLSTEIAELTGKRHDNVMRDIAVTIEQLFNSSTKFDGASKLRGGITNATYKGANGKTYPCYSLNYAATVLILTGYDVAARAKVITRWQELEKQETTPKTLSAMSLELNLVFTKHMCEMLNLPDSGRKTALLRIQTEYDLLPLVPMIATDTRPGATHDSALIARAATDLLRDNGSPYSVRTFNRKAIKAGFLEEKTRPSTIEPTKIKTFLAVTTKGLQYGKNIIHLDEMRGTQPNWYEDSFATLLTLI